MQESNLRLAALAIEVSPAYGIFRLRMNGRRAPSLLLFLSYPPCGRVGLEPTTSPARKRERSTEVWLNYGTVQEKRKEQKSNREYDPRVLVESEVSLLYGILPVCDAGAKDDRGLGL